MLKYITHNYDKLLQAVAEHIQIVLTAMLVSVVIAAGLTILGMLCRQIGRCMILIFSVMYTIPSVSLLALMIPFTGLGFRTTIIVLTIYNLYILLSNFIEGMQKIDAVVLESAEAMGMRKMQMLRMVQIPLAKGSIFTGIRLATVSSIQIATIAALINAGGLGTILLDGLRTFHVYKIICGAVLSAALAVFVNQIMTLAEKKWKV